MGELMPETGGAFDESNATESMFSSYFPEPEATPSVIEVSDQDTEEQDELIKYSEDVKDRDEIVRLFESGRYDLAASKFDGGEALDIVANGLGRIK